MIDAIDGRILEALAGDARMSLKELAHRVGLSSPSVSERLRRLEEQGVIRGYTVDVDPQALGYLMEVLVRIRPLPGQLHFVRDLIRKLPAVTECDQVTGEDCFVVRLHVRSVSELDGLLEEIVERATTNTAIVKAQPVRRRNVPV